MATNATDYRRLIEKGCETIFPLQAALGIGGNILTLIVLLSRPMRSRTNTLLACAAVSDILFLLAMIPNNLSRKFNWNYQACPGSLESDLSAPRCPTEFRLFYLEWKTFFTFLMNWFSGSSTWLIVAVSFDRLWAIKSPFSTRTSSFSLRSPMLIIPCIFVFTAILTIYMNFSFTIEADTKKGTHRLVATQTSTMFTVFTLINVFFQIFLPMALLILFNGFLLYYLKSRRQFLQSATTEDRKSSDETPPLLENQRKMTTVSRNGSNNSSGGWTKQLGKAERHVTITVTAIVSVFVLTHLPSAVLYANMYIFNLKPYLQNPFQFYTWVVLSTSIVITGKVANFFLFCMSSRHFRQQMKSKVCCCLGYRFFYKNSTNQRSRDRLGTSITMEIVNGGV